MEAQVPGPARADLAVPAAEAQHPGGPGECSERPVAHRSPMRFSCVPSMSTR
ncbi:hypothetical protein ACFPRL_24235 [Pseudoclavibacter helvolus]